MCPEEQVSLIILRLRIIGVCYIPLLREILTATMSQYFQKIQSHIFRILPVPSFVCSAFYMIVGLILYIFFGFGVFNSFAAEFYSGSFTVKQMNNFLLCMYKVRVYACYFFTIQ